MSEMVERAAKAMYKAQFGEDWPHTLPGGSFGDQIRDSYLRRARNAIEAMRDPSKDMLTASFVKAMALKNPSAHQLSTAIWHAMIDEAMK